MTNVLEILDPTGHVEITWDPDKPDEVARARAEFKRLQQCGYAFFTSDAPDAKALKRLGDSGRLDVRLPEQTKEFSTKAKRTVGRPPFVGG